MSDASIDAPETSAEWVIYEFVISYLSFVIYHFEKLKLPNVADREHFAQWKKK